MHFKSLRGLVTNLLGVIRDVADQTAVPAVSLGLARCGEHICLRSRTPSVSLSLGCLYGFGVERLLPEYLRQQHRAGAGDEEGNRIEIGAVGREPEALGLNKG